KEDFRYIVRMANTDLDGTRSVGYALTAISGVGIRVSEAVADLAGVPRAERLGNLSEEQTDKIEATLSKLGELFPPWMVNRPKDGESGLDLPLVGSEVEVRLRAATQRRRRSESLGDPKFSRAKFERPSHPWEAERIKAENELLKKYGLKNKKELWRSQYVLRRFRQRARELQARVRTGDKQAEKEREQ